MHNPSSVGSFVTGAVATPVGVGVAVGVGVSVGVGSGCMQAARSRTQIIGKQGHHLLLSMALF